MKLLFDANLSPDLVREFAPAYPGSIHVFSLGLEESDTAIWQYALENDFIIISKDSDFYHRSQANKKTPKIIWLRCGNASTSDVAQMIRQSTIEVFYNDESKSCMVIY